MQKVIQLYKTLSQTPVLTGAKVFQENVINTFWIQRNVETGKYVKFMRSHFYDKISNKYIGTLPIDISQIALMSISPYGKKRAVLREVPDGKNGIKQYLEIWTNDYLSHSVDLTALNIHGEVYTDDTFRSWCWSPDESKIVYIAEKKLPSTEPFYKRKPDKSKSGNGPILGGEYTFKQDWGENLVGEYSSVVAVYDLNEDKINILKGIPEELCPGQLYCSPDGFSIAGMAFETEPRKLGLSYFMNRPGVVFSLDFKGNFVRLTDKNLAVSNPQFSPDGKYLIWMERNAGGPYQTCLKLMKLLLCQGSNPEVVVDIVEFERKTCNNTRFYGFYNLELPERCWASNYRIVFSTSQKYTVNSYVVSIETGEITELIYENGSQTILDVFNDNILVSRENYLQASQCLSAVLPAKGSEDQIQWKEVTELKTIDLVKDMKYEFMDLQQQNCDKIKDFSAIYYGPKSGKNKSTPLIIFVHGGPHYAFIANFHIESSIYTCLGFAVLFINYRGSTGHGNASDYFILGRIGCSDVQDCILAINEVCKRFPWIDSQNLGLVGGSYGGFLVHNLSGQFPDMFQAAVSKNPVVDISAKSVISDVPDWSWVEVGSSYTQSGPINNDWLLRMREVSPIQHAHKIKAPTFLMLGSKDLRVPCSQGLELLYRLKANGVKVKANLYDDNHSLSKIPVEMDYVIHSALWFLEHLIKK